MDLLGLINDELLKRPEDDPIAATLRAVKREAYRIQTSERIKAPIALKRAVDEVLFRLRNDRPVDGVATPVDRGTSSRYLEEYYKSGKVLLNDSQIRQLLRGLRHLPDKQKVVHIVREHKGKVDPADIKRVLKSR